MADNPSELHQQAIAAALSCNWQDAVRLNELILEVDPKNVDALNRVARANFELGELKKAKKFYQLALSYDPYNQIAFKFLKKIEACRNLPAFQTPTSSTIFQNLSDLFIEEPGKTKMVTLLKVAEPQKLSLLSAGELVNLVPKNRVVAVTNQRGEYLGVLPDDLSHNMIRFIKGGNKYQALVKNVKPNSLSILLRETYRCARFKNQPSFLDNLNLTMTYSSEHIVVADDYNSDSPIESSEEEEAG